MEYSKDEFRFEKREKLNDITTEKKRVIWLFNELPPLVEHSAVNRVVAGSSPARGVKPAAVRQLESPQTLVFAGFSHAKGKREDL